MLLQKNIKEDLQVFISSSSLPPAVAPVLHSTIISELVQELCLRSMRLQSCWPYITMVGLFSYRAVNNAILLWFSIILAIAVSVLAALLVLDNRWMTLIYHCAML